MISLPRKCPYCGRNDIMHYGGCGCPQARLEEIRDQREQLKLKMDRLDLLERMIIDQLARGDVGRGVVIDYTNWRGERGERRIRPLRIVFEKNEWHQETQWLLEAIDLDKNEERTFALTNIHSWRR